MLKYSCSRSRLANWVLGQTGFQPEVIFPRKKGWEMYLRLFHPGDHKSGFFLVVATNRKEFIAFVPLDDTAEKHHIKQIFGMNLRNHLLESFEIPIESFQLVYMTSEKHQEYISRTLDEISRKTNLMVLDSEKMIFNKGGFNNPRLEFRLSRQNLDTDAISDFLPANLPMIIEGMTKSLFYQNIFHFLNKCWLHGQNRVSLRRVLKNSIPYWDHYRKKEQQNTIDQARDDLEEVFKLFLDNEFRIDHQQKNNGSTYSEIMVFFPNFPDTRKEINSWLRKQGLALGFLRDNVKQISIDVMDIK
ncbi:hypothetical protein KKA14_15230 [bacterium]|nr:hypothetical protein [bacterium]